MEKPLYIVGTGPIEGLVYQLIEELHMSDRVKMLGFKSGNELKEIVANALCVCLPSEWYENGPYSIMEAQAVGKPVIVSENGGLPELVENGVMGYIVKPKNVADLKDKLVCCVGEKWNAEKIVEEAKKKYITQNYANKILKAYKDFI